MDTYIFAAFIIFLMNALPAFAPPTWSILVFFAIRYELEPALLIPIGVLAASSGRWLLAIYFRKLRDQLPKGWVENMENAGTHFRKSTSHATALFLLFFLSPLSSAQLFEAAGVMKNQPLRSWLERSGFSRTISAKKIPITVTGSADKKTSWNECTNAFRILAFNSGEKVFKTSELFFKASNA